MKVPLKWLREYVDVALPPADLARRLTLAGFEVGELQSARGNWDNIVRYLYMVFFLVLIHNALALLMGYQFARLRRLPRHDARAISLETGIQNSGLGLILIFNFFGGLGGMAMIAAWWGVWHLISAFALATLWSARNDTLEVSVL